MIFKLVLAFMTTAILAMAPAVAWAKGAEGDPSGLAPTDVDAARATARKSFSPDEVVWWLVSVIQTLACRSRHSFAAAPNLSRL